MIKFRKYGRLRPLVICIPLLLISTLLVAEAAGQSAPEPLGPRIVSAIDESQIIELKGHVHPLARSAPPVAVASADLPMERMMLLLSGSQAQQQSLEQLLAEQHDASSGNYHRWLTPREFGDRFGPAQQDVNTVTAWLRAHGFRVNTVAQGRRFIEFSGTAAQVAEAFHTEINGYSLAGKRYWANAANPFIPVALAPIVKGIASLHNFARRPMHYPATRTSLAATPATASGEYNQANGAHGIGPYDFATLYNVLPLWNAGTDGTGQTIAIVSQSNIDLGNVSDFQNLFGLPVKPPRIILTGPDPGIVPSDEEEAELDVQWSGAVAKGASIQLVVSQGTNAAEGVDLSAAYIVDHNLAPIVSMSYGDCEQDLSTETSEGVQSNQFYGLMWQQAAAQGMSVFVSAGDSGAAGCDAVTRLFATQGFAVNGLASTPYNVAVGGTELNENGDTSYWNSTPDAHLATVNRYIPEVTWNETRAANPNNNPGLWAGSGGVSTIYSRPVWQTGSGVPTDDPGAPGQYHRLLPDVALSAAKHDGYVVCLNRVCPGTAYIIGGTSVSAQAFAGLMAMVNQSTGSMQGNPNFHFYPLSTISGVYHDVTSGTNEVPCAGASPQCSSTTSGGYGVTTGYSAGSGYDLATGWGSVDANALVTNWSAAPLGNTAPTLVVTAAYSTAIAGSPVAFTAKLSSLSATGMMQFFDNGTSLGYVGVSGGAGLFTAGPLALGSHSITVSYSGDANFAFLGPNNSVPFNLRVVQQATPVVSFVPFAPTNIVYAPGNSLSFNVQFSSPAIGPAPTGTLQILDGSTPVWTATPSGGASVIALNTAAAPFAVGTHQLTLAYSGDANWLPVSSSIVGVTIVNPDFTLVATPSVSVAAGASAGVSISTSSIAGFSGTLTFACAGLPAETSCYFHPASTVAGSSTYLTIATTAPHAASLHEHPASWRLSAALMLSGLLLCVGARRKQGCWHRALLVLLAGVLIAGLACSSGGGSAGVSGTSGTSGTPSTPGNSDTSAATGASCPGTPAGTYTVTVTATSGALTRSTAFTLMVN